MGSAERLIRGDTWNDFCDRLRDAGNAILRGPDDPLVRAEGFRYVSRLVRAGLEVFVEHADPLAPELRRVVHETVKMGADNPDNHYLYATVSGEHRYRITGVRGGVHYLAFGAHSGHYGQGRGMPPVGHLDAKDIPVGADGTFTIELATPEARVGDASAFLPLAPGITSIIVRQTRLLPTEELAALRIERLGGENLRPAPVDPATLDDALGQTGMLVAGATLLFASWTEGFRAHENRLPRFDQALSNAMGGVPDIAYYHSFYNLRADEALVVEFTPPPCSSWNFQLNDYWMESLDYRHFTIHTNSGRAVPRADGSYQIVVAHRIPTSPFLQGEPINWLETAGHAMGTMCFRWVRPEGEPPEPRTRVVTLDELARERESAR
ncbi:MAG: hypothetical protein U0271_31615 [Polyangiaceae bacterium]